MNSTPRTRRRRLTALATGSAFIIAAAGTWVAGSHGLTVLLVSDPSAAVVDLHDGSSDSEVAAAAAAADRAWATWHEANDYAPRVGVGDRTPTERAALQRLSKLVTRLTRSAAGDPELAAIKRDIQTCLDKVTTVSVGWGDIAALPAVERAGVLSQLGAATAR